MGKLEQRSRQKSKRENLQKIILGVVAGAGILSVGLLAPHVVGALVKLGILPKKRHKEYISSSASRMVDKGLMKYNGKFYELTLRGQEKLRRWSLSDFKLERPKKWDGKWRVLIFDIPEKKKLMRDRVRGLFKEAGILPLQKSVWVYPHDCEDIIALLKTDLGISKDLLYMVVDEIENDKHLRRDLGLL